jgi:transcription antitermination factor NusG
VRVEVRSGPFRGLQGIIEGRTPKDRMLLQVDILGQAVSVEIDGSLLDVIE